MAHPVSGNVLRNTLKAIRRVSGHNYPALLEQAGMAQYLDTLPPADDRPACTAEEYSRLPATVNAMLGEALTRLFLRNIGTVAVERALRDPEIQAMVTDVVAIPEAERLGWFIRHFAPLVARNWATPELAEDAEAWYITMDTCATCLGIHEASAPICASSEAWYQTLASKVLGRRVRVVEVECVATGQAHCKFAFYK